jgi:hypothetical protein
MLAVLEAILLVFVVTLEFNDVILEVFDVILEVFEAMFAVLIAISFVFAVMLEVFEAMFTELVAISFVFAVILAVFAETVELSAVMLEVLVETVVGKVAIVAELTPPTLFTTGAVAVPPKSFVNCNIPFVEASASGVIVLLAINDAFTKAVVAI